MGECATRSSMAKDSGVGEDPQRDVFFPRESGARDPSTPKEGSYREPQPRDSFAPQEPSDPRVTREPREPRERDRGKPDLDIPAFLRRRKPE